MHFNEFDYRAAITQLRFISSNPTIKTLEKGVKCVQS